MVTTWPVNRGECNKFLFRSTLNVLMRGCDRVTSPDTYNLYLYCSLNLFDAQFISVLVCQSWQGVHQARINRIIFLTLNIELFDPILAEGQELSLKDISLWP